MVMMPVMKSSWEYNYGSRESRCHFISMQRQTHTQSIQIFYRIKANDDAKGVLIFSRNLNLFGGWVAFYMKFTSDFVVFFNSRLVKSLGFSNNMLCSIPTTQCYVVGLQLQQR